METKKQTIDEIKYLIEQNENLWLFLQTKIKGKEVENLVALFMLDSLLIDLFTSYLATIDADFLKNFVGLEDVPTKANHALTFFFQNEKVETLNWILDRLNFYTLDMKEISSSLKTLNKTKNEMA